MIPDSSDPINLTRHPADDEYPAWSPDGTQIAFGASVEGGNYEVYRVDADGANAVRLTDHPADDRAPHWSPVADLSSDLE